MLFTKFIRGMAAGALALAALSAHAHTVPNTPLEKIPLLSEVCAPAQQAQVLDVPEENAFIYGDCASGTTINPYRNIDPDGRHPIAWAIFEAVAWLGARQAGTVAVVEAGAMIASGAAAPSVAMESAAVNAAKGAAVAARAGGASTGAGVSAGVTATGKVVTGASTNAGGPGQATNATVQAALDSVPQGSQSAYHGCCGEIEVFSKLLNAGEDVKDSVVATVRAGTGKVMDACSSCQWVANKLGATTVPKTPPPPLPPPPNIPN